MSFCTNQRGIFGSGSVSGISKNALVQSLAWPQGAKCSTGPPLGALQNFRDIPLFSCQTYSRNFKIAVWPVTWPGSRKSEIVVSKRTPARIRHICQWTTSSTPAHSAIVLSLMSFCTSLCNLYQVTLHVARKHENIPHVARAALVFNLWLKSDKIFQTFFQKFWKISNFQKMSEKNFNSIF